MDARTASTRTIKPLDHLPKKFTCIVFDRRETRAIRRPRRARHLGALRGAGQGPARSSGHRARAPHGRLHGLLRRWPRSASRIPQRDAEHDAVLAGGRRQIPHHERSSASPSISRFVQQHGLAGVVALVAKEGKPFGADPRGGPWASVIKRDAAFAAAYAQHECRAYKLHRRRRWRARCSTATRRRAPSPKTCCGSTFPRSSCRAATNRTPPRRRAIWKNACRSREYWDVPPEGADGSERPRARAAFPRRRQRHDHRHPRPLHDRARRRCTRSATSSSRASRTRPQARPTDLGITDEELVKSVQPQLNFQKERGSDVTIFSPRAAGMGHHVGNEAIEPGVGAREQRPDPSRLHAAAGQLRAGGPAAAVPGVPPRTASRSSSACVEELGFVGVNLNPDPSGGYWKVAAAHRPLLVSDLREARRARRARDDPRDRLVQPGCALHRRALHQRRHDGVHAAAAGQPLQGFPDAQVRDPARRRRGAVPLGPLPRHRAGHEEAAARASTC